jgi:hypothetical protein
VIASFFQLLINKGCHFFTHEIVNF